MQELEKFEIRKAKSETNLNDKSKKFKTVERDVDSKINICRSGMLPRLISVGAACCRDSPIFLAFLAFALSCPIKQTRSTRSTR